MSRACGRTRLTQADEVTSNACSLLPGAALEHNQMMDASFGLSLVGQDTSKTSQLVGTASPHLLSRLLLVDEDKGYF